MRQAHVCPARWRFGPATSQWLLSPPTQQYCSSAFATRSVATSRVRDRARRDSCPSTVETCARCGSLAGHTHRTAPERVLAAYDTTAP